MLGRGNLHTEQTTVGKAQGGHRCPRQPPWLGLLGMEREIRWGDGGAVVGKDWEFGISRCKLLYREWINNKVLLYSPGNYIQYPVINHNGKEYEKECIYV